MMVQAQRHRNARAPRSFGMLLMVVACVAAHSAFPAAGHAQTQAQSKEIRGRIKEAAGKVFSCSNVRKELAKIASDYPAYHFAFAGRKAPTITGIRGCGYAWHTNENTAHIKALENCRKWESKLGTGNGKYTCRLMR